MFCKLNFNVGCVDVVGDGVCLKKKKMQLYLISVTQYANYLNTALCVHVESVVTFSY